jgi:hypothetical protein
LQAAGVKACYGIVGDTLSMICQSKSSSMITASSGFVDIEQKAAGFGAAVHGPAQRLEGRRTRGVRPNLARAARSSAAACEAETDAVGDATLPLRCAGGRGRDGRLHCQSNAAGHRLRRPGNDGEETFLDKIRWARVPSTRTIARPVASSSHKLEPGSPRPVPPRDTARARTTTKSLRRLRPTVIGRQAVRTGCTFERQSDGKRT